MTTSASWPCPARAGLHERGCEARARPSRTALHLGLQWAQRLLNFPGVGQSSLSASGKRRCETGCPSLTPEAASPERLLTLNRGHWTIEATHHILDWSFDEDRSRIRTGHGPQNMTRLRRFAIGLIKGRRLALAEAMRNLARNPRRVLDFLKMTETSSRDQRPADRPSGPRPSPRRQPSAHGGESGHAQMTPSPPLASKESAIRRHASQIRHRAARVPTQAAAP